MHNIEFKTRILLVANLDFGSEQYLNITQSTL